MHAGRCLHRSAFTCWLVFTLVVCVPLYLLCIAFACWDVSTSVFVCQCVFTLLCIDLFACVHSSVFMCQCVFTLSCIYMLTCIHFSVFVCQCVFALLTCALTCWHVFTLVCVYVAVVNLHAGVYSLWCLCCCV